MRALCLSLVLGAISVAPATAERLFGLVIGIDDYTYITDLHGAVNDAEDIADALGSLGAEVTLLTDAQATRDAVLGAWERILDTAGPGDQLVVSYAGHGSNEPEHTPGSEKDGRDENFLLAGYAPRGEAAGQRIRDDEIADLLARSAGLDVIFVADACHAGTVTRNLNPALGYRYVTPQDMAGDPLPPPPPPPVAGSDTKIALFLAAVNEIEKVPEVLIDGTPRGALSYAFASGLRGAADLNGDAQLTKGELETHVRRTVRIVSDGAQLPQSEPVGQENRSLMRLRGTPPPPQIALTGHRFEALPPLTVGKGADWTGISGIRITASGSLRRQGPSVLSSIGDRVAVATDRASLQAVVDKHRLVDALGRIAMPILSIGFDKGDRIYKSGQQLAIQIDGRRTSHLTLFNLGADGTISLLYPVPEMQDPSTIQPGDRINLPVGITAPYGADHVVAIETDEPAPMLREGLAHLNGSRNVSKLWDLIRSSGGTIALFPFFTAEAAL